MASRDLVVRVIGDSRSVERAFGRSSKAASQFNVSMLRTRDLVKGIFAAGGIAVGIRGFSQALVGSISTAAKFEQTMQRIVGLSGVAQSAIGGLTDEILKLAPAVGRAPQELAEGLQFITSSGVPAGKAMAVLEVSAKAAAAGLGETKTVADAVTSVMNAYGAANVSAARATDVLVATVREGKGEAADFAGVIGNVTAIASQLGVSFEDVGASLAAMTRLGTDAETASTQLQQVFSNLVKVTPQAEAAFKKVGLSSAGLRKEIADKGLLSGLRTIREAFAGDIPGLAKAFGDIRALRGVLALVGNQAEATRTIFGNLGKSAGDLGDSFGAVSDTTAQKFNRLNAAIDTVQITIGAALAPAAEKAAAAIADWLSVTENQERVQREVAQITKTVTGVVRAFVDVIQALRAVLEPVVRALGGVENAVKLLISVMVAAKVYAFAAALKAAAAAATAAAAANAAAAAATAATGTAAAGAAVKVGILRVALRRLAAIGLIAIPIEIFLNREAIRSKFREIEDSLPSFLGADTKIEIDTGKSLPDLQKMRAAFAFFEGDTSQNVRTLDRYIAKLKETKAAVNDLSGALTSNVASRGGGAAINTANKSLINTVRAVVDTFTKQKAAIDKAVKAGKADAATKAALDALEKRQKVFSDLLGKLQLGVDRAGLSAGLRNDLSALLTLKAGLERQIKAGVDVADAQSRLVGVLSEIADTRRQIREQAGAAVQASQFRALGFDASGGDLVPGIANLKTQLASLTKRLAGSGVNISSKLKGQLAGVRRVLSGELGKATVESRAKIKELFDTIRGTFDQEASGPLTKTTAISKQIFEGLGLGRDMERELLARVSRLNSAGLALAGGRLAPSGQFRGGIATQPITVNTTVNLDGQTVARNTTKHQTKTGRGTRQKRGPNRRIGP